MSAFSLNTVTFAIDAEIQTAFEQQDKRDVWLRQARALKRFARGQAAAVQGNAAAQGFKTVAAVQIVAPFALLNHIDELLAVKTGCFHKLCGGICVF